MRSRKLLIVLTMAGMSGGVATYLSVATAGHAAPAEAVAEPTRSLVVAARAIAPGTSLRAEDLTKLEWSGPAVPSGTFATAEELIGRVVRRGVAAGEPVLASGLAEPGTRGGLTALIPAGMRAMSVAVDEVVAVNGFMGPGARVDVIATLEPSGSGAEVISRVVLQDVEVIASGHHLEPNPTGEPQQAPIATLLLTPEQAEELVLATHRGRVHLVLRGSTDHGAVFTAGARPSAMMGSGSTPAPAAPVAAAARAPTRTESRPSRAPRIRIVATDGSGDALIRY